LLRVTIASFPLVQLNVQFVSIPFGARFLSVTVKNGQLTAYALVDLQLPKVQRKVLVVSTGKQIPSERWEFVGTAVEEGKVWHVFAEAA